MLRPYPIVAEPTYGFLTEKWIVRMSEGPSLRFVRRAEAVSFIATHKPSLKALLSASVKETGT